MEYENIPISHNQYHGGWWPENIKAQFQYKDHVKLEQLERLRSEDTPPPPHDYPHYWVMLDPKSKQGRMTLEI